MPSSVDGKKRTYHDKDHTEYEIQDEEATKGPIRPIEQGRIERVQRIPVQPYRGTDPASYDDDSDGSYRDETPRAPTSNLLVVEQDADPDRTNDLHKVGADGVERACADVEIKC